MATTVSKDKANSTNMIGDHSEEYLYKVAQKRVEAKTGHSKVLQSEAEDSIPKFDFDDLVLGRVLGCGGFCVVNEITSIVSRDKKVTESKEDDHTDTEQDRNYMESHCMQDKKEGRYVIKRMKKSCRRDAGSFVSVICDLAIESRFLSVVRHPHLIQMRGMDRNSPYSSNFFIVLDRLVELMPARLQQWKKRKPSGFAERMRHGNKREIAFWLERCSIGLDLASALAYLHGMHIMYRDIKPDNIGFDRDGNVKIFDLDLVKEFDPQERSPDGTFLLTGNTGSPRYMAPEVALNQPYNETCDVYSLSIFLWEMLASEAPYGGFSVSMLRKFVYEQRVRPKCDPKWSKTIATALVKGWGPLSQRPSMEDMCEALRKEIATLSHGATTSHAAHQTHPQ